MDEVNWFLLMLMLSAFGWTCGRRFGMHSVPAARGTVIFAATLLVVLTYLVRHPAVGVQVLPVSVMARIEGVASVPVFMTILGVAWARSQLNRQRAIIAWAMLLGAVYFVNGGLWMLQQTPTYVMGQSAGPEDVMQSQDYTCVPAASATALRHLGIRATEAEMARLTHTRPGTGSTTVRALDGLNVKLAGTPWTADLIEVPPEDIRSLSAPMLSALQFESTRRHMVVIAGVTEFGVRLIDPVDGRITLPWREFHEVYTGQVIVFNAVR